MGGIGKTVLAKALTDDPVVQRAFPDGIVWITAGKEKKRDFIEEMREVAKALGDDPLGYDTALACENQYRTTIAGKAALIVVDDVWSKADIEPLLAESPRSRFLFTTRDASIGRFVSAREHRADLLDLRQSRELLASWANVEVETLPAPADDIVGQCGRLPLALSIVGAMLRDTGAQFWTDTLDLLCNADLSAIEDQLPEGQQSFFKAVEVGYRSLKPEIQERYKALAVLLEDMPAPLPILETLWNVNEAEARRMSKLFVDRSLAQPDGTSSDGQNPRENLEQNVQEKGIRLHDLQLDYVRAQFPDRKALDLIHGAVRLSSHVINKDPDQFVSQMVGRLLPYQDAVAIKQFAETIRKGAPKVWVRPLHPTLHPPGTALIRTLNGHTDGVNRVAVSADGRRAVSASADHTLKVWNVETGREVRSLEGHSESVSDVALSVDGRLAVSASRDHTLKVWDVEAGRALRTLQGHPAVRAVALTPDGTQAISASDDNTLRLWDLGSGRELHTFSGHTGRLVPMGALGAAYYSGVSGIAVTPDSRWVVSGGQDGTLRIWDINTAREVCSMERDDYSPIESVVVSQDGLQAVSGSRDGTLTVWELSTGRELRTFDTGYPAWDVALMPDGQSLVSTTEKTLKVWDLATGQELVTLSGHSERVNSVSLTSRGKVAFSASSDKTVKIWDLECSRQVWSPAAHANRVSDVAVGRDGRRAASASWDHTIRVWDVDSGRTLYVLRGDSNGPSTVAMSGDSRVLISAWGKRLRAWDLETGADLSSVEVDFDSPSHPIGVNGFGDRVLCAAPRPVIWNLRTGAVECTRESHRSFPDDVALSWKGTRAISSAYDEIKVWDLNKGYELRTIQSGHWVYGLALSEDGKIAVSASRDTTLKVWNVEQGRELRALVSHSGWVNAVALSADARIAVSASADHSVKLWSVETGRVLTTFFCDSEVECCDISGDGELIIAGDASGHVHFLRLEQPKPRP